MTKNNNRKILPFNLTHLIKFRRELKKVGSFDSLMLQKEALGDEMGMKYIGIYKNIEGYKMKFLVGEYATLRSMYDTEMPYIFWSELYKMLLEREAK